MDTIKNATDVVSVSTIFATVIGYLPEISALFALIYTLLRIYENKTFQKLLSKLKRKNSTHQND